jgi:uncharacterized damage-inducible protein DinB
MSSAAATPAFTAHLVRQYEMPRRMIAALADDFTDEQATARAGGQKPLVWYLGHVAITDNYFLKLYGDGASALSDEHINRYGRGSDGHADFSGASKAEMVELLETLGERVRALLSSLAAEDLERATTEKVGHPLFKSLGSALSLIVAHAAYHAGQIADLRREMGKDPLFG